MEQANLENKLLQIVKESKIILQEYENRLKQNYQVILLIGVTGAGKSTLFNFLAGADFEIVEDDEEGDELRVKHQGDKFSQMKDGMSSITKKPKYYFNDQMKHVLIDFPGFYDTNGEMDQLLVQMLFFKIVTKSKIKVVYVIRHPENSLSDRGIGLQEFIKDQFEEQNLDSSRFTIVLNSYNERLQDEKLVEKFQKQLVETYQRKNEKVLVVRKVRDPQTLQLHFSPQKRQQLWQQLIGSNQLEFKPKILPKSESVSSYLRQKCFDTIVKYSVVINDALTSQLQTLENEQILPLQESIKILYQILQETSKGNITNWFVKFIQTCQNITQQLKCQDQIVTDSTIFMEIFVFFSQFAQFINGFKEYQNAGLIANAQCKQMLSIIKLKLEQLEERKKHAKEIDGAQNKIQVISNQNKQIQEQFKNEIEKNKNNQQQLQILSQQQQEASKQYQSMLKMFEKQIENQNNLYQDTLRKSEISQKEMIEMLSQQIQATTANFNDERKVGWKMMQDMLAEEREEKSQFQKQINTLTYKICELESKPNCIIF